MTHAGLSNFGDNATHLTQDAANWAFSDALDAFIQARPNCTPETVLRAMVAFTVANPK